MLAERERTKDKEVFSGDPLEFQLFNSGPHRSQLMDAHVDYGLALDRMALSQFAAPLVKPCVSFQLHYYNGILGDIIRKLWMLPDIPIELFD